MDLTQLERIKMDLKQKRYGQNKIWGPRCRDGNFRGFTANRAEEARLDAWMLVAASFSSGGW
jgi:hypothetical protein